MYNSYVIIIHIIGNDILKAQPCDYRGPVCGYKAWFCNFSAVE